MYLPFHSKYRPQTLDDLIGQEVITKILRQEIVQDKIPNSYLFYGSRGSGKTSTARILAKALNCLSQINGNPCNSCTNCRLILDEKFPDVMEMDAGSNSGVDDARQLTESCRTGAIYGKYKIFILDEAHNLTRRAWDVLLKLIEEPMSSIKFILCTTEIEKIPSTILSRNQVFQFNRISSTQIVERLGDISQIENISLSPEVLEEIALKSDGSLRDSLILLEQIRDVYEDKELVDKILFRVSNERIQEFLNNLESKNYDKLFKTFYGLNIAEEYFINKILHYLLNLYVVPNDFFNRNKDITQELIDNLANWKRELTRTISRQVTNEFYIIKLCSFFKKEVEEDFIKHVEMCSKKLSGTYKKVNNNNYLIITQKGAHLNVVRNGEIVSKGYYTLFPTGTIAILDSAKTPVELIKEGIIKRV